jgi:type I restriction enzyme M protein
MFVQSAGFVNRHKANHQIAGTAMQSTLSIYGQERVMDTVRLCKMNLAVHGLAGDIRQANSYYEDNHNSPGKFDFVMANPPFNVNNIDKERIKDDTKRFPFGMPRVDNGNYIWIQLFFSALNDTGRAGFVMANSACDARQSELDIRKQLIEDCAVDVMVAIGSNFFYTVTLPCTLWFLDNGKRGTRREDKVLFLDARQIFNQIDRAHREFTPEQIAFLASIVGLNLTAPQVEKMNSIFSTSHYDDIAGLCKVVTKAEIEAQNWSLNPGRYVGVAEHADDNFDFYEQIQELNENLGILNTEAHKLEDQIEENISNLLQDL